MQELSKEQYISTISDLEKIYLVELVNDRMYLLSDIEKGGDIGLRIENMFFEMNTLLGFQKANRECRGNYSGGISFIEYNDYNEAECNIINDFINLEKEAIYLSCFDTDMEKVIYKYPSKARLYIVI